jgi:hypothetical protein
MYIISLIVEIACHARFSGNPTCHRFWFFFTSLCINATDGGVLWRLHHFDKTVGGQPPNGRIVA